ncbi:CCA tRNA nucleotidyltransferase [Paenibacillus methanolicus]|uniref:tRNA nucleotidyltransferase (CCA-adding enzyme) n=1 Tax=Paenibacillus methanolicus TaxID=582686 RepID=A0A5S5CF18_9BACL|nr:CCA tRNA nucleotidyltransferase [Paenibacillus methanolicus]TYP77729.1 tRNA nucleotidyltransferase (CCA-adding enzyme) [Paenibacillus methanolicus]
MKLAQEMTRALPVIETLQAHGYEAVFVGGCVRDTYMGRPIKDVDLATSATPEQVIALFPNHIPTGLKHGTVTVLMVDTPYEVTTYRTESEYEQFRRPQAVQFVTSLEADLLRRDFTMNAMAVRADGTLVDPYGGAKDIDSGILRCVGDADARFQEDALRMVRAVRFAGEFRLRIALGTWRALRRHAPLLRHVAMERIGAEADKMMSGSHPRRAVVLFARSGLLAHAKEPLPLRLTTAETSNPYVPFVSFEETHDEFTIDSDKPSDLNWLRIGLVRGLSSADAEQLFEALKYANSRRTNFSLTMSLAERMNVCIRRFTSGEESVYDADRLQYLKHDWVDAVLSHGAPIADNWLFALEHFPLANLDNGTYADADFYRMLPALLRGFREGMAVTDMRGLAVSGGDVMRHLSQPSGPWLGELLKKLLSEAAHGRVDNVPETLLQLAEALESQRESRGETR